MGAGIVDLTYSALLRSIIKNPYFPLLRQEYPQLATAGMTGLVAGAVEGSAFILLATYMLLRRSMTE